MLIPISQIKIKKRVRKDLGNLDDLKESLKLYGLMNPITVNKRFELIAGERRLQAAKQLGWTNINVNIIDNLTEIEQLEMELEENNQRKEFTDEELMQGYKRLERLRHPNIFLRIWLFFKHLLDKIKNHFEKKHTETVRLTEKN